MSRLVRAMRPQLLLSAFPFLFVTLFGTISLIACGEEEAASRGAPGAERSSSKSSKRSSQKGGKSASSNGDNARDKAGQPEGDRAVAPMTESELPEAVFIETDENRDPFRSFLPVFTAQALPEEDFAPRPPVLLDDVSLDELRLIAVISGEGGNPRAMVTDPEGKGWVVRRGDYVGRGERIRLGPGQPHREINWRIVRVRPDRIILVREDPIQAGPPVTRVMRLYPEEDD